MRIPEAQIAQIVDRLDIVDVVGEYSALRQRGNRYWGLCPFHAEKTPSFTVSADKSAFYCFGCGKGGGLIQFVMDVEQLPFPEAVRMLAERAGVQLEAEQRPAGAISRREYVELNSRIAETFHHVLRTFGEAAPARDYLEQRGIGPQALAAFKLGWAPAAHGWLLKFLRSKQFSDQFLAQSGLFTRRGGDTGAAAPAELRALFWGRLMFPIVNARGEVLAFGGRTLAAEGGPKYVNSAETPFFRKSEQLFGLNHALPLLRTGARGRSGTGAATDAGPTVTTGTSAVPAGGADPAPVAGGGGGGLHRRHGPHQPGGAGRGNAGDRLRLRACPPAEAISTRGGGDVRCRRSGPHTAALRSLRELARHEVPATVVPLPAGRDPADLVAAGEGSELQRMLESPITASRYTIEAACSGTDLSTAEGKEHAFRDIYPYVREIDSVITRDALLQEVAVHLRLDYDTVRAEFRRRAAGARSAGRPPAATASAPVPDAVAEQAGAELRLMLAVSVNRELFAAVRSRLEVDDFEDARARVLYIALEDCYRNDQTDTEHLLLRLEPPELRSLVAQKLGSDEFTVNTDAYVSERRAPRVKSHALERKRDRLHGAGPACAEHEGSTAGH